MRLPVSKIYRAFPELDRFSDDECERFIARAQKAKSFQGSSITVILAILGALATCCLVQSVLTLPTTGLLSSHLRRPQATNLMVALSLMMWIGVPALTGLIARDMFLRKRLRDVIWRNLERIRCPHCRYSLLGQRVINDEVIVCPECGGSTTLETLGLSSPDDLIPPLSPDNALNRAT